MAATHVLAVDLAKVWRRSNRSGFVKTLGWGDPVEVLSVTEDHLKVRIWDFVTQSDGSERPVPGEGFITPPRRLGVGASDLIREAAANQVLKVDFVDVQQGDGCVIETPSRQVILVDGGDNQLFARYLAGRFRNTSNSAPFAPEAVVVTHGDADHFAGLTEIRRSETHPTKWKRLFMSPKRVFHNGLVKRPAKFPDGTSRRDTEMLGETAQIDNQLLITGLVEDPRSLSDDELNLPFRDWAESLRHWATRGPLVIRAIGEGARDFDFLLPGEVKIDVLGPMMTELAGHRGLRFLGEPPSGPRMGVESVRAGRKFSGKSASHTINGHSLILRLTYRNVRMLLTGDLNEEASTRLVEKSSGSDSAIQAEVFKVPHHGSADFDPAFFEHVAPVISVVSSGDENARKEYIHPRATLVGALGRSSRVAEPLVFVTELVAFFETKGWTTPEYHRLGPDKRAVVEDGSAVELPPGSKVPPFFAFDRRAFGIVRIRTDGRRILVFTDSGQSDLKEAYAYEVGATAVTPSAVIQA